MMLMKKTVKWIGISVITPILLFIILAVLLYLPPVQNWVVQKVATIASEKTGMEITVEHVSLEFPLDLGIEGFRMLHRNDSLPNVTDTIADVGKLVADVRLLPLLKKRVIIDELSLHQAKINTNGFISDLRIKGDLDELWLYSRGIDLDNETAEVNGARLSNARLDVALSDTAATDTTASTFKWIFNADSLCINNTGFTLHLPGDTMNVQAFLGKAVARRTIIDTGSSTYKVKDIDWKEGQFRYDDRTMPHTKGFDYNHIAMSNINLNIGDFSYSPSGLSLHVHSGNMKEQCGIHFTHAEGGISFTPGFDSVTLKELTLRTPDSDIYTETSLDFNIADEQHPGQMFVRLNAQLGKQDMLNFLGNMPQKFMERYPNHPLGIKGSINGNMQKMDFTGIDLHLPTALQMNLNGTAENLTELSKLKTDIKMNATTQDMNFVTALITTSSPNDYRIPSGMTFDGTLKARGTNYSCDLTTHDGSGSLKLQGNARIPLNAKGEFATESTTYDASIRINSLNLHHFMPKDSIYTVTADINAKGYGTDFLSSRSHLTADATVHHLQYGHMDLKNIAATANLEDGRGQIEIRGRNELFDGIVGADLQLNTKKIEGTITANLQKADLFNMRIADKPLTIGMNGNIDISSDMKQTHRISGLLDGLYIQDAKSTYHPKKIGVLLNTNTDTTYVRVQSGDFIVKLDANGGYEKLLAKVTTLSDSVRAQYEQNIIDQPAIKRLLPTMKIHVESKSDNPIATFLRTNDIRFNELMLDMSTSPQTGINGQSYLYSLNYDSTRIDTIRLNLTQKGDRLSYQGQIRNNRKNPQFVFNALLDGHFHEHGLLVGLRYYDKNGKLGVRLGATAEMESEGIRFKLMPERPTIGYKEFNLNKDNFIFINRSNKIQAKIDLVSDDKTGMKLYTENQDSTMLQDLTISLHRIDLGEVTSVLPYIPKITGRLNGDFHILQDQNQQFSVVSDMGVMNMTYEDAPIGNISTELVYLMRNGDNEQETGYTHAIEARLMLDDEEFGLLSGSYQNEGDGAIDAVFKMNRLPLSLANGFIPDKIIGFEGYCEGSLTIKGTTVHPEVNGEVFVDSAYLTSVPYSVRMRLDSDPVRVVDSRLLLENYGLYANNEEPLIMMGNVDFSNTDRIMMDLRMRARNLLLINAKQEAGSIAWGKAFVNFFARMQGPLEQLNVRGRLDLLGSTDMYYMLLDSPLSTDNRLDELVKFTDFSDSTQTVVTRPAPSGLIADLNISIAQGARVVCYLNAEQKNYVDLTGGGDLRMKYNDEGINLTGRYTLNSGEMKYSLPVIPLKTFTVKDGSYVEFTGDPMNPKLNITATERTKATVSNDGGGTRSVLFDCGVIITKTLNDMGLEFIIDAPEDQAINGELTTMSTEERGKLAVTMLTTGLYLADGSTGNFSMNSALSSFLQSEINQIAGSALKTLDLSIGIDNTTDASGTMRTDYSFKFAKRFFNNRLKIELGGKVSSASGDMGQNQSFFDNVSMEYRLNQEGTQNLKLFYKQNVYDWLEGYTSEYGGGFVWRRKLDNFWDIFRFWRKEPQPAMRPSTTPATYPPTPLRRDTTITDSIRKETAR